MGRVKFTILIFYLFINCYSQVDSIHYYSNVLKMLGSPTEDNKHEYLKILIRLSELEISQNNFDKALNIDKEAVELTKQYFGESSIQYLKAVYDYSTSNLFVGTNFYNEKEYKKSRDFFYVIRNNYEKFNFKTDEVYLLSLQFLGLSNIEIKDFKEATDNYRLLFSKIKDNNQFSQNFNVFKIVQLITSTYSNAINYYLNLNDWDQVNGLYRQLNDFYEHEEIEFDENLVAVNLAIALKYIELSRPESALPYFIEVSKISKIKNGEDSYEYGESLISVATCYYSIAKVNGDYNKAVDFQVKGLKILENIPNVEKSKIFLRKLNLLSYLFDDNQFQECINLSNLMEMSFKEFLRDNPFDCFLIKSKRGQAKMILERYVEGEKDLIEANKIFNQLNNVNNYLYLTNLQILGDYNALFRNYEKAMNYYEINVKLNKKKYEEGLSDEISLNNYLVALGRVAKLNSDWEDYEWAYFFRKQQIEIYKKEKLDNFNYVISLSNLITTCIFQNKNTEILDLIEEIENWINKNNSKIDEKVLIDIYSNISSAYMYLGYIKESTFYKAKSYNLYKKHREKMTDLEQLSSMASFLNFKFADSNEKSEFLIKFSNQIIKNTLQKIENTTSYQLLQINSLNKIYLSNLLSFLMSDFKKNNLVNNAVFENIIINKNLSLRNQNRIRETITEKGTPEVKEKFQTYLNQKRKLAHLEIENTESSFENYKQLSQANEELEKELIRLSSEFADAQKDLQIDWKDLQKKLKPDEAIVDLVSFNLYTDKWTDSIQYAAFVLTKESEFPKFIPLFEESELRYNLSPSQKDSLYKTSDLYSLVFSSLEKDLAGKSTLYYSPSGLLHQINLKAVQDESGNKLGDRFNIHLLGSPTELMKLKETYLKPNVSLILYGAIDYDKAEISEKENTSDLESNLSELVTRSGIRGWSYLPGTLKEIQSINEQAKKKGYQSTIIEDRKATKNSFLNWNGKKEPFVLHLATHGFFFENEAKDSVLFTKTTLRSNSFGQTITLSSNPMIRSGILFAGANKSWNKPDTNNEGILTASEIASLDLTHCELVVLSACDTGLGDINGSEGVFGLQRAFKLAGVKNIIMSLWKVPDEQTAELFDYFYQELFFGKSVHQSLETAQTKMKEKYEPYYWAGFVLLE